MNYSIKNRYCNIAVLLLLFTGISLIAETAEETKREPVSSSAAGTVKPAIKLKISRSSDKQKVEEVLPEEAESNRIFRRDLILQINEIIKKIQEEYPVLSEKLDTAKEKEILKSIVKSLNGGMRYASAAEMKRQEENRQKEVAERNNYPAIMLALNKILYIRIPSFSIETVKQIKKECDACTKDADPIIGIIIDLRNSQSLNNQSAIDITALFASAKNMQKMNIRSSLKQVLKQPVIILTGEKTRGDAEIFTRFMIKMKRAVSLGEKSAGIPFAKKSVTLSNGDYLLIPQIPEKLKHIPPFPVKPSIKFSPYPQLAYDKLAKTPGSEKDDRCIQRAVELILCLNALKHE